MNTLLSFVYSCLLLLPFATASASGGSGAGVRGGGIAVWIGGRWEMKDVFQAGRRAGAPMALSGKIRAAIRDEVRPLVELYTGTARAEYWDLVLDDAAEYRLVDRLPCPRSGERLARGERNFGCTLDGVTYFVRDVFLAFDNGRRVLAILHERGHALDPSDAAHDWIAPFVDGVRVLLDVAAEQERGEWRRLGGDEVKALDRLAGDAGIARWLGRGGAGDGLPKVRTAVAQGGGVLVSDAPIRRVEIAISESSFVGVGSALDLSQSTCGTTPADVEGLPWVTNGSRVVNSVVQCHLVLASRVVNSRIAYRRTALARPRPAAEIGALNTAEVLDAKIVTAAPFFVSLSRLANVDLEYFGARQAVVREARLANLYFRMPWAPVEGEERLGYAFRVDGRNFEYPTMTWVDAYQLLTALDRGGYLGARAGSAEPNAPRL